MRLVGLFLYGGVPKFLLLCATSNRQQSVAVFTVYIIENLCIYNTVTCIDTFVHLTFYLLPHICSQRPLVEGSYNTIGYSGEIGCSSEVCCGCEMSHICNKLSFAHCPSDSGCVESEVRDLQCGSEEQDEVK